MNNVVRTCLEAMAAPGRHAIAAHPMRSTEALALPSDASARIARNTQIVLQARIRHNTRGRSLGRLVYVERLEPAAALCHIREVEDMGGMARRSRQLPSCASRKLAARTQARIDERWQPVIGVNAYRPQPSRPIKLLQVRQMRRCANCRSRSLRASSASVIRSCRGRTRRAHRQCRRRHANLLALASTAARAKATVGEISSALENVFGPSRAEIKAISGRLQAGDRECRSRRARCRSSPRVRGGRRPEAAHLESKRSARMVTIAARR